LPRPRLYRALDAFWRGQICRYNATPTMSPFVKRGGIAVGHNDMNTLLREQVCRGFADTVRAGGDKPALALNPIIHKFSVSSVMRALLRC
jgi:hypothetical protein